MMNMTLSPLLSVARGVWNNLLLPYGEKYTNFRPDTPFLCPNKRYPYLATAKNSVGGFGREDDKRFRSESQLSNDFWDMVRQNGMDQCPL